MKVKLLKPVKRNGQWYKIGEEVEVKKEEAERLFKLGAAEEVKKKEEGNEPNKK